MGNKKQSYETLDDIGFIGVQGYKLTQEDLAIFAQKGREARRKYLADSSHVHMRSRCDSAVLTA